MALTPSQRISLISEINDRLSVENWSLIDLTLNQFSVVPTVSGGKSEIIINALQDAPDHTLIELAHHVGFEFKGGTAPGIDPPFWQKGMLRVFLSHLSAHREFAAQLQAELARRGIWCFVAHNDIEPTAEWQNEIQTALSTADALVALLHPNFHASNWTDQEIGFAMGRSIPVFSVRFSQDPYGFIGRFQAFNGAEKSAATLAKELFDAYRNHKQTKERMAEVLIRRFEESESFAQAKNRIGLLEQLDVWDTSFSQRLEAAVQNNNQISGSWGVPEKVAALVKKWK
jgi:hypothetical protein